MSLIKTEEKTLERDISNMALLTTDTKIRDEYLSKRKLFNDNKKLRAQVETMVADIEELKKFLRGNN